MWLRPLVAAIIVLLPAMPARAGVSAPVSVLGEQSVLMVPVRFPRTQPSMALVDLKSKAERVDRYVRAASYGKAWLAVTVSEWIDLPDPLSDYAVSPHNYSVDKRRVDKLVADSLGIFRSRNPQTDIGAFKVVWIVPGVRTNFGVGYGMIAYAINPGMLSNFYRTGPGLETVRLTGGGTFSGAGIVSAENAHVGHAAHDLLHALGGAKDGRRAVPDLYDFDLQSAPPTARPTPALYATHVGPWDIMSQHFVEIKLPPPMPSAFTRRQLGWIDDSQIAVVAPGESKEFQLAPLSSGQGILAVRVPLGPTRYLMIENRQNERAIVKGGGMIVMAIDTDGNEGAHAGKPIAQVIDAAPSTPSLDDAAFASGRSELSDYADAKNGIKVTPLALAADGTMTIRIIRR